MTNEKYQKKNFSSEEWLVNTKYKVILNLIGSLFTIIYEGYDNDIFISVDDMDTCIIFNTLSIPCPLLLCCNKCKMKTVFIT